LNRSNLIVKALIIRNLQVVNPKKRTVSVYNSTKRSNFLHEGDQLDGASLLPDFTFPVKELFEIPDFDS
jgi:Uma2 family endonuclease